MTDPRFVSQPCSGLPGKEWRSARGQKERLTRYSCCEGESFEGCDAIGKGHGKPISFPGARQRYNGSSEPEEHMPGSPPVRHPSGRLAGTRSRHQRELTNDHGGFEARTRKLETWRTP